LSKQNRVTSQTGVTYGSAMSNYASVYSAWDSADEEECPVCRGTGLDRDEVYDCEECAGEGYIVPIDSLLSDIDED
jgi:DnaJ-class molecular chaperone